MQLLPDLNFLPDKTMTYQYQPQCRQCGTPLKSGARFCDACGAPVSGSHNVIYQKPQVTGTPVPPREKPSPSELNFPGIHVAPRIGEGLNEGWGIVTKDIWGGIIAALLLFVASSIASWVPILGAMVYIAAYVGFFAWVESVRSENRQMELGRMVNTALDNFSECLMPAVWMFVYGLVVAIPIIIMYFTTLVTALGAGAYAMSGGSAAPLAIPIGAMIILFAIIVLVGLSSPLIMSWLMMTCWGIYRGANSGDSMSWAWERIKAHPFNWWLVGLVTSIISSIGVFACYVGVFFTIPWALASLHAIISDPGEGTSGVPPSEPVP